MIFAVVQKGEKMDDLISRQAVIDALDSINCFGWVEDSWEIVRGIIERVPAAQPETLSCGGGNLIDVGNGMHLVGKTITEEDIDGFGIELKFTDGSVFTFSASDGGCSSWDFDLNCRAGMRGDKDD